MSEDQIVEAMARAMNIATDGHDRYWSGYMKSAHAAFTVARESLTEAVVYRGPAKFAAEEVADGYRGIRWITAAGVYGRPSNCDVRDYLRRTPSMNTCTCDACKAFYTAPPTPRASNETNLGG